MRRFSEEVPQKIWRWVRISDAIHSTIDLFDKQRFSRAEFTYIDISSVDSIAKRIVAPKAIATKEAPSRATYIVRKGDILVSTVRPNLNAVALVDEQYDGAVCSSGFCVLRFKEGFWSRYFFFYFVSPQFVSAVTSLVQGAMYPAISDNDVKAFQVPTPTSVKEQVVLAQEMETKWKSLQGMRDAAESQFDASDYLIQGVLRGLFPFSSPDSPPTGWHAESLKQLSESIQYGLSLIATRQRTGPKYVRITDIQDGSVNWESVPYCECSNPDTSYAKLEEGDILFARTGATTGKSFLISTPPLAVFASYLIRVRCKLDRVLPEYLYTFFQSKIYWDAIGRGARGGAQAGFNASMLGGLRIPLPPSKNDQAKIAAEFDEMFKHVRQIRGGCAQQLAAISALPAAMLRELFSIQAP